MSLIKIVRPSVTITFDVRVLAGLAFCIACAPAWAQSWQALADMPTPRSEVYCATIGKNITIAGGLGHFATVDSCETYDTKQSSWSQCPALPRRLHHVAMASDDTLIYSSGGYVSLTFRPDPDGALWSLAPLGARWEQVSALPHPIGEHTMVRVGSALFLIGGRINGKDSNQLQSFDLATRQWTALAPMKIARHSSAAVVVDDEIWILGGRSTKHGSKMTNVEIYSVDSDQWRNGPSLPTGSGGHSAALLANEIHIFGGEQFHPSRVLDRHDVLNLETSRWRTEVTAPQPRHGTAACVVDDQVYLIGGATRPGLRTVFSVTGALQTWTPQ